MAGLHIRVAARGAFASFIYLSRYFPQRTKIANNRVNTHPLQNHVLNVRWVLFRMGVFLFFIYLAHFFIYMLKVNNCGNALWLVCTLGLLLGVLSRHSSIYRVIFHNALK